MEKEKMKLQTKERKKARRKVMRASRPNSRAGRISKNPGSCKKEQIKTICRRIQLHQRLNIALRDARDGTSRILLYDRSIQMFYNIWKLKVHTLLRENYASLNILDEKIYQAENLGENKKLPTLKTERAKTKRYISHYRQILSRA